MAPFHRDTLALEMPTNTQTSVNFNDSLCHILWSLRDSFQKGNFMEQIYNKLVASDCLEYKWKWSTFL